METRPTTNRPQFWTGLQPSIVRVFKVAGLVALTAILVGLSSFVGVGPTGRGCVCHRFE